MAQRRRIRTWIARRLRRPGSNVILLDELTRLGWDEQRALELRRLAS